MYIIISKRWKWESFKPFFHHIPEVYMIVFTNSMHIFRECPGCYTGFLWDYRWLCSAFDQSFDYRSVQKGKSVETASLPRYSVSPWANNFRKERWTEGLIVPYSCHDFIIPKPLTHPYKGAQPTCFLGQTSQFSTGKRLSMAVYANKHNPIHWSSLSAFWLYTASEF